MKKIILFSALLLIITFVFLGKTEAALRPTVIENIKVDVSGTEILVSIEAKWEDEADKKIEREVRVYVFDAINASDKGKTLIEEKVVPEISKGTDYIKLGAVKFGGLKPEKKYLVKAVLFEKSIPSKRYVPEKEFVEITTAQESQRTFTTVSDPAVFISGEVDAVENKTKYNLLAPIGKIKYMDKGCIETDETCISNNIGKYLNFIFKLGIGLCAALAVIMLILNGVQYMGDESVFGKTEAKHKMYSAIFGLIIALAAWAILNTINPDLTGKNGITLKPASVILMENLSFFDSTNVTGLNSDDALFLGYMAHQQGAAGIKAILTAAKNNTAVSDTIMTNMKNNFYASDAKKTIGTSELTPATFIQYWSKKLAAVKLSTVPVYGEIDVALSKAAQDTGVDKSILIAMCRLESLKHCSSKESITSTNGSYSGLFQIGKDVWNKYKQSSDTNIFDPYANARVAALYFKDNLKNVKI